MAAALWQEVKDIVEAASRASLPDMAVVMAPINKGALRPPIKGQGGVGRVFGIRIHQFAIVC